MKSSIKYLCVTKVYTLENMGQPTNEVENPRIRGPRTLLGPNSGTKTEELLIIKRLR